MAYYLIYDPEDELCQWVTSKSKATKWFNLKDPSSFSDTTYRLLDPVETYLTHYSVLVESPTLLTYSELKSQYPELFL